VAVWQPIRSVIVTFRRFSSLDVSQASFKAALPKLFSARWYRYSVRSIIPLPVGRCHYIEAGQLRSLFISIGISNPLDAVTPSGIHTIVHVSVSIHQPTSSMHVFGWHASDLCMIRYRRAASQRVPCGFPISNYRTRPMLRRFQPGSTTNIPQELNNIKLCKWFLMTNMIGWIYYTTTIA